MIHHNRSQNQPKILDQTIDNTLYKHYTLFSEPGDPYRFFPSLFEEAD